MIAVRLAPMVSKPGTWKAWSKFDERIAAEGRSAGEALGYLLIEAPATFQIDIALMRDDGDGKDVPR